LAERSRAPELGLAHDPLGTKEAASLNPQPAIVFSHANGFPAGTYRLLFEAWRAAGYRVHAVEKYGHDPRFPVTSNWPHLRDQLLQVVEQEAERPVTLVGHSLGGYLSVLAASRRPDWVRGVVLLDSPILGGLKSQAVRFGKFTGAVERYSPGRVSVRRRQHWPDAEAAHAHFAAKAVFARWEPEVLRDYIASGVQVASTAEGTGHGLAFRREIETSIYNTLPHHMSALLRRHPLRCPVAFVGGRQSAENRQVGLRATERLTQGRMSWLDGSHLFPFEQPAATAAQVLNWLEVFAATHEPPARQGTGPI
jgi:pimeloyl-ACP methyl ester carboxylesterase